MSPSIPRKHFYRLKQSSDPLYRKHTIQFLHISLLRTEPDLEPRPFWINTSGNDIVRNLLSKATQTTKQELEKLVAGESIDKTLNRDLTYCDIYNCIDNLWSVLYATGYLTVSKKPTGDRFRLKIPNQEIRQIYVKQIMEWFRDESSRDKTSLDRFCQALSTANAAAVEEYFNAYHKT